MVNCTFCDSYPWGGKTYYLRKGSEYSEVFVCSDCLEKIEQLKRTDKKLWTKKEAYSFKKMTKSAVKNLGKLSIAVFTTLLSFGLWLIKQGMRVEGEWSEAFSPEDLENSKGYEVSCEGMEEPLTTDEGIAELTAEDIFAEEPPFRWEELEEELFQ